MLNNSEQLELKSKLENYLSQDSPLNSFDLDRRKSKLSSFANLGAEKAPVV